MTFPEQSPIKRPYEDEVDLGKLFSVIWEGKWLIGAITAAAAVISIVVSLLLPNIYRAEALLAPIDRSGASSLSALAAQYGGLASLAGLSLGGEQIDKTAIGLEILKSRKFISEFIERYEILPSLFAAKGWDDESGSLIFDSNIYEIDTGRWVRGVRPPQQPIPSPQEAYEKFLKIFSVTQDKKNGFVTISIEFFSPQVAKQWVDWLIDDINAYIMRSDVAEAEQAIEYLNQQIANTSLSDLQSVFFRLIEEQMKTVMLANVSEEYLLKTLDPAVVPELKAKPNRAMIVILVTMLAGFAGITIQVFRNSRDGV